MPLLSQQWGPKFDADEILGLEKAVKSKLGKELAGVGFFTLDGVLSQKEGHARRYWHSQLQKLNETYKIPCAGDCCGCAGDDPFKPTPAPPVAHGSYTVQAGDSCWAIADKFCQDGNDWSTKICNANSVSNQGIPAGPLQTNSAKTATIGRPRFATRTPCATRGFLLGHCRQILPRRQRLVDQDLQRELRVQPGDSCWAIADKFCQDGNDWSTKICNANSVCNLLQPGQTIKYDCSGKGSYCNGPAPGPSSCSANCNQGGQAFS